MAKGWKKLKTVNDVIFAGGSNDKYFTKLMKTTKSKTAVDLKDESVKLFNQKKAEDAQLLSAFEEKRLKSKDLIKRAMTIKKDKTNKNSEKEEN